MTETRTALVTGATRGIGRATAIALRQAGYEVIGVGRDLNAMGDLAKTHGICSWAIDVRRTAELSERLRDRPIDVMVSAAGVLPSTSGFHTLPAEMIDEMIQVNLIAPLQLARATVPAMIARRSGHLVFVGSSAGHWPHPNAAVYGASKAGLSLFCDALRCDLLGSGIRVTEIAPGRVQTDLYRTALGDARSELYDGYEPIQPNDIASLILTAITLPSNVDVSRIEVFPTNQAVGGARIVKSNQFSD